METTPFSNENLEIQRERSHGRQRESERERETFAADACKFIHPWIISFLKVHSRNHGNYLYLYNFNNISLSPPNGIEQRKQRAS